MNLKKPLFLTLISLSAIAQAAVVKVKVRNLGDGSVTYMKSTCGMITSQAISPALDADSCFTIDSGDYDGIDLITFDCTRGKERINHSVWIPFVRNVTIDFEAENRIDSDEDASVKDASAMKDRFLFDFYDYMDGVDRLHLKGDTVAASVYEKLISHADSISALIGNSVPENIANVFKKDIDLTALYWLRQCAWRVRHGRNHLSDENAACWDATLRQMKDSLELHAPENALSYNFKNVVYGSFADYAEKEGLLSDEPVSKEEVDRLFFRYVADNLTGKVAETLCGRIIVEDTEAGMYSGWIPALAADFYSLFPASALQPVIKESVAENLKMNAPKDMTGINLIATDSVESVAQLISRYKGRPVLVDVWATWCRPCRESFREHGLLRQFAAEKDIVMLYISIDERDNAAEAALDVAGKYGLKGDHVVAAGKLREDVFTTFGNQNGILSVPHNAFFDEDGKMAVKRFQESEAPAALLEKLRAIVP